MSWIIFASITVIFFAVANILDKYVASNDIRDSVYLTFILSVTMFVIFSCLGFVGGHILIPYNIAIIAVLAGVSYSIAVWIYYFVIERMEVTKFMPIIALTPAIIAVVSFFFFSEHLKLINYLAILIIIIGVIVISHQKHLPSSKKYYYLIAFISIIFFAIRDLLIKYCTMNVEHLWAVLFWAGLGGAIVPIFLIIFHHPHLRKKAKAGIGLVDVIGLVSYTKAISLGSVALAASFIATKPLIVLILALIVSAVSSKIIREKFNRQTIIKKIVGTILIVLGGIGLVL